MSQIPAEECGGCAPPPEPPRGNPPGQSSLRYRLDEHAGFRRAILAGYTRRDELSGLTTRAPDDPAVALADAAAALLDVLTFYQERIANEGYLRTATERASLLELARAVGYELRPALSASLPLAFEVENEPVSLPAGIKAQSIPGPGETPQTFETVESIAARPEWNALRPLRTARFTGPAGATRVVLRGVGLNLKPGDLLLLAAEEYLTNPNSSAWDVHRVREVKADPAAQTTTVTFAEGVGALRGSGFTFPAGQALHLFAFRRLSGAFGANAPDWKAVPADIQAQYLPPMIYRRHEGYSDWPNMPISTGGMNLPLDAIVPQAAPGSWVVLVSGATVRPFRVSAARETGLVDFMLSARVSMLTLEGSGYSDFAYSRRTLSVFCQSEELALAESPRTVPSANSPTLNIPLVPQTAAALDGTRLDFEKPGPALAANRRLIVTGRVMRLVLTVAGLVLRGDAGTQKTLPVGASLLLLESPVPIAAGRFRFSVRDEAGFEGSLDAYPSQGMLSAALPGDPLFSEAGVVDSADEAGVTLKQRLVRSYDPNTVTIHANVALAANGETRREILGAGDAAQAYQRFTLKGGPVAYDPDSTLSGARSTLQIRAAGLEWSEVESLLFAGPLDEVFAVHIDDDGAATVQFGDGEHARRLPSGRDNIVARYRTGGGSAGNLPGGRVSLLLSRPMGLKAVSGPVAAVGGDDAEPRDMARRNAPLATRTLDRLVSVYDYEDFARAYAGIGKARASLLWDGGRRTVALSLVGPRGLALKPGDPAWDALEKAVARYGLPRQPFRLLGGLVLRFGVQAKLTLAARYDPPVVFQAARAALAAAFAFESRDLGQAVTASSVMAGLQSVPGVERVDLDSLYAAGASAASGVALNPLRANLARLDPASGQMLADEMWVIDEHEIHLA